MEAIWKTTRIIGLTCCFALIAAVSVDRASGTDNDSGQKALPQKKAQFQTPTFQEAVPSTTQDAVPAKIEAVAPESSGRRMILSAGGEDCDSATVIPSIPYADDGDTSLEGIVDDYDESCFGDSDAPDLVYSYTPTDDLECITVSLCGSSYDTKLFIYEDACGADPIACNDDLLADGCIFQSQVTGVPLTGGSTYYIVVDGWDGNSGEYTMDVTSGPCPAVNDDCADRIFIEDGDHEFNTTQATTDGQAHLGPCDDTADGQTVNDIWYNYIAECSGTLLVSTCNQADYDSDIVIYGGEGACNTENCPPGDEFVVGCNDDGAGCANFTSTVSLTVTEGDCFKIRLGGWDLETDSGTGILTVDCSAPSCGDGLCLGEENCLNCPADCGGCCGNGICDSDLGENCASCGGDCGEAGTPGAACGGGFDPPCDGECFEGVCLTCQWGSSEDGVCDGCNAAPLCDSGCDDCGNCSITQSVFPDTAANEQVACASGVGSTENGWARCFNHAEEGISGDLTINSVTFGVQQATVDDILININIYTDAGGCPPDDTDVNPLIAQESLLVGTADVGTFITVPFPGVVIPAGTDFIVEVEAPISGSVADPEGQYFFRSMANNGGQCGQNYLRAASCGISFWIDMAAIGFPTTHFALSIGGTDETPTCETLIIKQGACPAPVNPNSNGVIPMLLVGDEDFDVNDVDPLSLALRRCDGAGDPWSPLADHTQVKDLNHPEDLTECGGCTCNDDQSSDGIDDLSMKFRTDETLAALLIGAGDGVVGVELIGTMNDGSAFKARDCIMVVPPGAGAINATMQSNVPDTFIGMTPLDLNVDSDGFANFTRSFIEGTTVTMTAPTTSKGRRFLRWNIDGTMQGFGVRTIDVLIDADTTLKAFYQRPSRVVPELPTGEDGDME